MRKRTNISFEPKHILAFFTVLCLILIFVSFRYSEKLEPIKSVAGDVLAPMQKGINTVGKYISDQVERFASINELLAENASLKEQLADVSNENKLLQQDKYELQNLRDLLTLDETYSEYNKVAARVISKDSNNWYNVFTIDKGTNDGLANDMNVVAGNGLVGIIIDARHNHSIVRSIIDDKSNVWGSFMKTSDDCNVSGDLKLMDEGKIHVENIPIESKIKDGDEVVTSRISNKFLPGILIGYVSDIQPDASNLTKSGKITPVVDFKRLDTVLVITELKEELY